MLGDGFRSMQFPLSKLVYTPATNGIYSPKYILPEKLTFNCRQPSRIIVVQQADHLMREEFDVV